MRAVDGELERGQRARINPRHCACPEKCKYQPGDGKIQKRPPDRRRITFFYEIPSTLNNWAVSFEFLSFPERKLGQ